jgi:hypothetical protein
MEDSTAHHISWNDSLETLVAEEAEKCAASLGYTENVKNIFLLEQIV